MRTEFESSFDRDFTRDTDGDYLDSDVQLLWLGYESAALHAAEMAQQFQWREIESAPRDQKIIAGYWNVLGKWRTVTARYYTHGTLEGEDGTDFAPEGWYEESETHETLMTLEAAPVLWMPLPIPPPQDEGEPCLICHRPVYGYKPLMCCSGHECGCMGQPTNPCVCSKKCSNALLDNIGMEMEERRKAAGIALYRPLPPTPETKGGES